MSRYFIALIMIASTTHIQAYEISPLHVNVRVDSQAGISVAVADGISNAIFNPAGLAQDEFAISDAQETELNATKKNRFIGFSLSAGSSNDVSIGLSFFNFGLHTASLYDYSNQVTLDNGQPEMLKGKIQDFGISYGHEVWDDLAIGISFNDVGLALDGQKDDLASAKYKRIGLLWEPLNILIGENNQTPLVLRIGSQFSTGATLAHAKIEETLFELPKTVSAGVAVASAFTASDFDMIWMVNAEWQRSEYQEPNITQFDARISDSPILCAVSSQQTRLGTELRFNKAWVIRGGVESTVAAQANNTCDRQRVSLGLTWTAGDLLSVNLALSQHELAFDQKHSVISLGFTI
jgi:hypothetical protein